MGRQVSGSPLADIKVRGKALTRTGNRNDRTRIIVSKLRTDVHGCWLPTRSLLCPLAGSPASIC